MVSESPRARQVGLLRLLLLAMALAIVLVGTDHRLSVLAPHTVEAVRWLVAVVAVLAGVLVATVGWVRVLGQLVLHLVFDLLWISLLIYGTGGVASPAVVLLFAIILIANLILPGTVPFIMPALAALVMAGNASLYLANVSPFPSEYLNINPQMVGTNRILGLLAIQVGAFFLVDLLGQLLARRLNDQRIFTNELLDQLGEGVLAIDRQDAIAYANAEALRLLDLAVPLPGMPVLRVLAGPALEMPLRLLTGTTIPVVERWTTRDGRQLVLRVTALKREGRNLGRTMLIADETRLRLLELDAQRAAHLADLGAMAAGIAHEVRNPLTSLRGCAQELAIINRASGHEDGAALASIMVGEADRLARIVNDFLTLSKMRAPEREALDLGPVIEEQLRLCRARPDLPLGLRLEAQCAESCSAVYADPGQIRQILGNLLNNALDAVLHSQTPLISCRIGPAPIGNPLNRSAVVIEISDNGCGIPNELQERIFTPFFSTKAKGTGLGLSLVSRIIREHEGLLSLDSAPGIGTSIRILLPAHTMTGSWRRALGR